MSATTNSFSALLNQNLTIELLRSEVEKRNYILQRVKKKNGWKGGTLIVPFIGADPSSVQLGSLTADTDVSEMVPVRGTISGYKEAWFTMLFNAKDIIEHDGRVPEDSFLRLLVDKVANSTDFLSKLLSLQFLNGPKLATLTQNGDTNGTGVLDVDRIDRFELNQKIDIDDDDSPATSVYVIAIDQNNKRLTVSSTRGGGATSMAAYSTAQNAALYIVGGSDSANQFSSIKSAVLSSANGGSSSLYGVTKTAYPFLQAFNQSGADIDATNLVKKLFSTQVEAKIRQQCVATEIWMSSFHWGAVLSSLENQKGAFRAADDRTQDYTNWDEIMISGPSGAKLKLVGIPEMDKSFIVGLNPDMDVEIQSNGLIRRQMTPDGNQFYVKRASTGWQFIVDHSFFGDLVFKRPKNAWVLHSIPDYSLS